MPTPGGGVECERAMSGESGFRGREERVAAAGPSQAGVPFTSRAQRPGTKSRRATCKAEQDAYRGAMECARGREMGPVDAVLEVRELGRPEG